MTTYPMGDAQVRLFMARSDGSFPMYVGSWAEVTTEAGPRMYRTLGHANGWGHVGGTVEDMLDRDLTGFSEVSPDTLEDADPDAIRALQHQLEQLALARRIATEAHAGQTDKLGVEYIEHPRRVAARLDEFREQAVAWLHDVVEDTDVTEDDLRTAGLDEEIVEAVLLLTRTEGDDHYYARIAASPLARSVKLADIADNADPERVAQLDEDTRTRLAAKYRHARRALGAEEETR